MPKISNPTYSEGLKVPRLLMVLSSISPLFILWAIKGSKLVPDRYFVGFCAAMSFLPTLFLLLYMRVARDQKVKRELVIGSAEDHRDHLLVYLFAMLLPLYAVDAGTWRDFAALVAALGFVVFLFWHLNLHYMNLFFAIRGYRVFTILPPIDKNAISSRVPLVLVTARLFVLPGDRIVAYRLSNTVYFEVKECRTSSTLELQQ